MDLHTAIQLDLYNCIDLIINNRCFTTAGCFGCTIPFLNSEPGWINKFGVDNLKFIGTLLLIFSDFQTVKQRYLENMNAYKNDKLNTYTHLLDLYNILNDDVVYLMKLYLFGKVKLDKFVSEINKFNEDTVEINKYYTVPVRDKIIIPENIIENNFTIDKEKYTFINTLFIKLIDILFFDKKNKVNITNSNFSIIVICKLINFIMIVMATQTYELQQKRFEILCIELQMYSSYNYF